MAKARDEAEAKVEQLLKDKAGLNLIHQHDISNLAKLRVFVEDTEKQWDATINKCTLLAR